MSRKSSEISESVRHSCESEVPIPYYTEAIPIGTRNEASLSRQTTIARPAPTQPRSSDKEAVSVLVESVDAEQAVGPDQYGRFSRNKKRICVALAAMSCFLSPMSGLAFLPAVPEIAHDFSVSGEAVTISAAVYCVAMALSPCLFLPISDIYGRQGTFLVCLVCYCLSSIVVAVSKDLAMFMVWRFTTGLFATAFLSVAAHMVSDIFEPSERGRSMSWILSGTQLGTALGGVVGGIIVNYTSWRVIFFVLAGLGAAILVPAAILLPETLQRTRHQQVLAERKETSPHRRFVFIGYNPFRVVAALRHPTLSLDGFIVMAMMYNMYSLLTPIRYVMNPRFGLTQPLYSGLFYLAPGLGYFLGTFIGGRWADYVVRQWTKKRGRRVPEDRLRQAFWPLAVVYPVSVLVFGWSVERKFGGVLVPVVFMFLSGLSQTIIFPATNAYCLDSVPELNGDGIASSYFSRFIAAAVGSATCLTSIRHIGVGWTCTISAAVLWVAAAVNLVLIFGGEPMRMRLLVKHGLREQSELDRILQLRRCEPRL